MLASVFSALRCVQLCTAVALAVLGQPVIVGAQGPDIQYVTTGQELQQAVFDGVKHIIVTRHLDMVLDPLWDRQWGSITPSVPKKSMLSVANGTQTITV